MSTITTVISNIQYGVPSGNYDGSSQDFFTDPVKGVGFWRGYGSIQTITIALTDFVGIIKIAGSLNDLVDSAIYFPVDSLGDGSSIISGVFPLSFVGNFVWIDFEITGFRSGQIDYITVTW